MYMNTIREGEFTQTIYTLIKDERFEDVTEIINSIHGAALTRAGLSLLGYSYYRLQKFIDAANCYEQLCVLVPGYQIYKLYYAQCLYQCGLFDEAINVSKDIDSPKLKEFVLQLQSGIMYSSEDYSSAQAIISKRKPDEPSTLNDEGCLLYQANMYNEAIQRFNSSIQMGGFNPLTAYNTALCHYKLNENSQSLGIIAEIVERGICKYPELGIGAQVETEGGARSVGNPPSLASSGLNHALNLKAAIQYQEANIEGSREALLDLPPRAEHELDPVTLHNMALTDPNGAGAGLRRLAFLLELGPPTCPQETFANILLLCCKHEMYDTAADILAEHAPLTYKYLSPYLYELIDALITAQTSNDDAEKKLGILASSLAGKLRQLAAKVQECRGISDQNTLRNSLKDYEKALDDYLPVVMARAWLPWKENDFADAEREFRSSAEFCSENNIWRLHAAHVLFMRGDKYKEAAAFYEPLVRQHFDDILSVPAAVLANLCVSYIMTFQNVEAEELIRKVERAEDEKGNENGQCLHLCIINLVVGTLYCAKSNYEFGLSRIAHALEGGSGPRLCADTWLHVKRCVLGLLTGLAKQTVVLPSPAVQEVKNFLQACEIYGLFIPSVLQIPIEGNFEITKTIGMEARQLRYLILKIMDYE